MPVCDGHIPEGALQTSLGGRVVTPPGIAARAIGEHAAAVAANSAPPPGAASSPECCPSLLKDGERVSGYQTIRYQRDGDIGTLTLARPGKRNAQNPLMWEELARLGAGLLANQTLRCLVVTGERPSRPAST